VKALRDKNPRVRLQAVIGLARLGYPHKSLLNIAAEPVDNSPKNRVYASNEIIPHIARKALVETGATQICLDGINDEPTRQIALAALQEMHTTEAVDGLIQKLQDSENPSLNTEILTALCRLYYIDKRWDGKKWWSTRPDDRGPYFEPVEWEASPRIGAAIKTGFAQLNAEHKPQMIAKMKLNRIDPAALGIDIRIDEALAFIASSSPGTVAIKPLRKAALDGDRVAMVRSDAFNALGRITGNEAFNAQLAIISEWQKHSADQKSFAPTVREFIYEPNHLGRPKVLRDAARKQKGAAKIVTYRIALQLEQSPLANDSLRGIMGNIIRRGAKNAELLTAIGDSGSESYRELVATAARSKDAALAKAALAALNKLNAVPATGDDDKRLIVQLGHNEATALLLEARGDTALGSQLFARQACIACHTTSQDQPQKGPYLGDAGKKWKRADLIQSILKPSAVVSQGFQTQWFELKNGTTLEGFVTGEKDGIVDLRNIAGIVQRVKRSDVAKSGTRTTSMMPEGLAAGLTVKEMASLLDYMQSLK
jgi:putative heme-binding domain-containing protein